MWPDRVSNPGPLTYKSGALQTALCGPAPFLKCMFKIGLAVCQKLTNCRSVFDKILYFFKSCCETVYHLSPVVQRIISSRGLVKLQGPVVQSID